MFWIYFVQSYIGVFYHAFVLQDFKLLRQSLIDRMLVAQVRMLSLYSKVWFIELTTKGS